MTDKQDPKQVTKVDKVAALERFASNVMEIWADRTAIWKLFAPDLTDEEFKFFCGLGIALRANPFAREIWAVKYDGKKPAAIFLARDFYRKRAQEQESYDGHIVGAIYSKDSYSVKNGMPEHSYDSFGNRGELLGAYCLVYKKGISHPTFVEVKFSEYDKKQSTWISMPGTMIKKVPEAQALRSAFQGLFQGTYSEDEQMQIEAGAETVDEGLADTENFILGEVPGKKEETPQAAPKQSKPEAEPKTADMSEVTDTAEPAVLEQENDDWPNGAVKKAAHENIRAKYKTVAEKIIATDGHAGLGPVLTAVIGVNLVSEVTPAMADKLMGYFKTKE